MSSPFQQLNSSKLYRFRCTENQNHTNSVTFHHTCYFHWRTSNTKTHIGLQIRTGFIRNELERYQILFSYFSYEVIFHNFFLLDLYQINMAYAYWKAGKTNDYAVFDLFFRKNPFQGEFTIFAGLEQCIKFLDNFQYTDSGEFFARTMLYLHT